MNTRIILTLINIVVLIVVIFTAYRFCLTDYGRVISGSDWTAKQYGSKYVVSVNNHANIADALNDFVTSEKIKVGIIVGIGAINSATLRFYNPETKQYSDKTFDEQMEISNLRGNISTKDNKPYIHMHVTLGKSDYNAIAGHLLDACVNGAAEFWIENVSTAKVSRKYDEETGLQLYDF